MSTISSPIPNLFNGVSQQPASLRHPSQAEAQENAFSDIATGLRKRAPTQHIARLTTADRTDAFVHTINRDTAERYKVLLVDGDLFVYDLDGVEKTVAFPDGKDYLDCDTPRSEFAVMTVQDYSFIVNRTVTTALHSDTVAGAVTGTKQLFSDLPTPTGTGNIYKVQGDPTNNFDDYYVKDTAPDNVWVETAKPGEQYKLDPATMPHKLVRESDGTFTFSEVDWENRLVGDLDSNPTPSFIGAKIRDVFFYRNRLGVIADEAFVLSRPAKYFNYWIETITAALDSDPIDADASHNKVSLLNWAVPFSKALLLFSSATQFQVTGGDTLTQRNAKADPMTEFESSAICRPFGLGPDVFFVQDRGNYTGMLEYYVDDDSVTADAADTTAHAPAYVPSDVFKMTGSHTLDTVLLLTLQERNALYVYKYFWGDDDKKLQSAWSKFTLDSGDTIIDADFIGTICYLVVQRTDGCYLEKMDLRAGATDTGFDFQFLVDRRVELTGSYEADTDETTWTLPFDDEGDFEVYLGAAFGTQSGRRIVPTRPSSATLRTTGDFSAGIAYVGRAYAMRYRFSTLHYRDDKGAVLEGRLQLSRMLVAFANSGYFRAEVTPLARDTYSYAFTAKSLGTTSSVIGTPTLQTGTFQFPLKCRNEDVVIEIVNDSAYPSVLQSAVWTGEFVLTTQRVS
jgi:hypothetical protein